MPAAEARMLRCVSTTPCPDVVKSVNNPTLSNFDVIKIDVLKIEVVESVKPLAET